MVLCETMTIYTMHIDHISMNYNWSKYGPYGNNSNLVSVIIRFMVSHDNSSFVFSIKCVKLLIFVLENEGGRRIATCGY